MPGFPPASTRCPRPWSSTGPVTSPPPIPPPRPPGGAAGNASPALQRQFPQARFDRIIRRLTDLDEHTYQQLTATVAWLDTHPTSGLLLRQLPIEGIGTKWLAQHAVLVLALLGDPDFPLESTSEEDMPTSARIRLHQRLGLRTVPDLVQVAVLDPDLRAQVGGMRHFAASVEDLNTWQNTPRTAVILENKETAYAITGDHAGVVVLHGHGFSVVNYGRIAWIRHAQDVIYWGDLDLPGLQFVSDLRGLGIPARTILTDVATLNRYRHLAIPGAGPQRTTVPHLTRSEQELYTSLSDYAAAAGTGLLLEQERIPWPMAYPVLTQAIEQDSPEDDKD